MNIKKGLILISKDIGKLHCNGISNPNLIGILQTVKLLYHNFSGVGDKIHPCQIIIPWITRDIKPFCDLLRPDDTTPIFTAEFDVPTLG